MKVFFFFFGRMFSFVFIIRRVEQERVKSLERLGSRNSKVPGRQDLDQLTSQ